MGRESDIVLGMKQASPELFLSGTAGVLYDGYYTSHARIMGGKGGKGELVSIILFGVTANGLLKRGEWKREEKSYSAAIIYRVPAPTSCLYM